MLRKRWSRAKMSKRVSSIAIAIETLADVKVVIGLTRRLRCSLSTKRCLILPTLEIRGGIGYEMDCWPPFAARVVRSRLRTRRVRPASQCL